jgi:MOSC domain-containing protein YiiM
MPRIVSIQIGLPRTIGQPDASDPYDRPWTTAFVKEPVAGDVRLTPEGLEGDQPADTQHHGGPDKAVLLYSACHYPSWHSEYPQLPLGPGAFGENWTVDDLSETDVCIGDIYAIGDALVQVSQPRIPCWKISRRWRTEGLTERVRETGRTGWHVRVLRGGTVRSGMELQRVERPFPDLTVALANDVLNGRVDDSDVRRRLAECPALAEAWRKIMTVQT